MFDLGWQEFLVIAFVLVIVVGPKELPRVLKTVTKYIRQMRQMAGEFHKGLESMADEAELKDVKNTFNEIKNSDIQSELKNNIDPGGEVSLALQQAKKSADLANELNKVEGTIKEVGELGIDSTKENNENILTSDEEIVRRVEDKKAPSQNL